MNAISKWEIAGISVMPVVEAVLAINAQLPSPLPESLILHIVIAIATIAAIARALIDAKKAKA